LDESAMQDRVANALSQTFVADLAQDTKSEILAGGIQLDVPAGSVVYRDADEPRVALVVAGLIRVYLTSSDGRQLTVRYARTGALLGVPTAIGGPAAVSTQALTQASLMVFNLANLRRLAMSDPRLSWALAEEVTQRLYEVLEAFSGNAFGTVRQRLAKHMLDIAAEHQAGSRLVVPIGGQALADAIGTAREVVARALHDLRAAGIVASTDDGILVIHPDRLEDVAQNGRVTSVTSDSASSH
jgi:CRP/FNR family transcriptional regulator, cyclic AMP receptor protein